MLSCIRGGAAAAEVTPGLGTGVTGLGGPSGTWLGLPGCNGGHKEAHGDDEEEVVVADSPNLGEAIFIRLAAEGRIKSCWGCFCFRRDMSLQGWTRKELASKKP
uniref:Uncharacterized protein n=1 Tax=Knipowitschia caucasica TaxID=637954 RepID=A0AAV2JXT3_KNICA